MKKKAVKKKAAKVAQCTIPPSAAPTTPTYLPPQTGDNGKEHRFQPGNKIGKHFQPGNKIGFQSENQLARKHGLYAKFMTEEEENFVQEELKQPSPIDPTSGLER